MDKESIVIDKIRAVIDDNQIRLWQAVELLKALCKMPKHFLFKNQFLHLFTLYIKDYSRFANIYSIKDLFDGFSDFVGYKIGELYPIREAKNKPGDVFVKFETYKLFYYKIWPEYVKALGKKFIEGESLGIFRYNIPSDIIKSIYTEGNAKSDFCNEIISLANINGLDAIGVKNGDNITIEIEI